MTNLVTVGLQWGDEGKGKVVDCLAGGFDIVARFQGGSNAGHTVVVGDTTYKFRIMPSGVVQGKTAVIGNGVVVDLDVLIHEIEQLARSGIPVDLVLSERAHIITPLQIQVDGLIDEARGKNRVGTTRRGIGPTYGDKILRSGVRMIDLLNGDEDRWNAFFEYQRGRVERLFGSSVECHPHRTWLRLRQMAMTLRDSVADTGEFLVNATDSGKKVLFEGAQGTLLDIDHGTYPFVTSSNCVAAAASVGTGVPPSFLHDVLGVCKAYTTRVGAGPFPTELSDEMGEELRERGGERGTVTGRARRCGWLDLVALRYASRVNGVTALAVTKVDVLAGIRPLRVCVAYRINGEETTRFPADSRVLARVEPVLEDVEGWTPEEIEDWRSSSKAYDDLPGGLREYLALMAHHTRSRIALVSTGPARRDTVVVEGVLSSLTDASAL